MEIVHKGGNTRDTGVNTLENWLGRIEFDEMTENAVFPNMNLNLVLEHMRFIFDEFRRFYHSGNC